VKAACTDAGCQSTAKKSCFTAPSILLESTMAAGPPISSPHIQPSDFSRGFFLIGALAKGRPAAFSAGGGDWVIP